MNKILIVVDMQNDFIDGALGTAEAQKVIPNAVNKIRSFNGDVYATLDTHYDNYLETSEGINLPVMHCIKDSYGWKLNDKIQDALNSVGYTPILKPTFGSTELATVISENYDISDIEIELMGLCTDICVVSNALLLKAFFPEVKISVDESCCAGVTRESHNAALATMRSCQINIIGDDNNV